jgi:glycosyltransferase involved in cell wall biosynthesis
MVQDEPELFARAIVKLLTDGSARHQLGQNARKTAERVYDWNGIAAKQAAMYERLRTTR